MSEEKVIKSTDKPVSSDQIYQDLQKIGVSEGDLLLVHSSLSSIGWVCGGPQAVVSALLKATGAFNNTNEAGTLVMPAHSGDWSDPAKWENPPVPEEWIEFIYYNMPAFIPEITPTRGMGRIAELFRTIPGVVRSNHPQVSFCAIGRYAERITEKHVLSPQLGLETPLGKMYGLGTKVLLFGVGFGNCTSFHLAETLLNKIPIQRTGTSIMENGDCVWKWFTDYAYNSDDFDQIGEAFEAAGYVTKGQVGNAVCSLFDMKAGVDFAAEWLKQYRFD